MPAPRPETPVAARRQRPGPARKPVKDTGPSDVTRLLVYEMCGYSCVACGRNLETVTWRSIQHRVARGVGGGNSIPNLILLCGSATSPGCHRECEDRDPEMRRLGYWLRSGEDPATRPIWLVTEHRSRWVLVTDQGFIDCDAPEGDL